MDQLSKETERRLEVMQKVLLSIRERTFVLHDQLHTFCTAFLGEQKHVRPDNKKDSLEKQPSWCKDIENIIEDMVSALTDCDEDVRRLTFSIAPQKKQA